MIPLMGPTAGGMLHGLAQMCEEAARSQADSKEALPASYGLLREEALLPLDEEDTAGLSSKTLHKMVLRKALAQVRDGDGGDGDGEVTVVATAAAAAAGS